MRILGGGTRAASDAAPFLRKPSYAFVDVDNIFQGFRSALQRNSVEPEDAALLDPIKLLLRWNLDRYFIFTALPKSEEPSELLRQLQATERCVLRTGRLVNKGKSSKQEGVDVRLAIEAMQHAFNGNMVSAWIFSGDGDLIPLVDALVDAGVFVTVASFSDPNQGSVAPLLRDRADRYEWIRPHDIYAICAPREFRFADLSPDFHTRADLQNPSSGHDFCADPILKYSVGSEIAVRFRMANGSLNLRRFTSERTFDIWQKLALPAEIDGSFYTI